MSLGERDTLEAYHADTIRIDHSMLRVHRRSPARYHGRFIAKTIPAPAPTRQQTVGSVLHLSFETPDWEGQIVTAPPLAPDNTKWYRRKGSDHERWWQEWKASCAGKYSLSDEERASIYGMRGVLLEHPIAGPLLQSAGEWERTVHWTDAETGLPCKCRPDLMLFGGACLVDLKTASDPSPEGFNHAVQSYDYAHQQEWYRAGVMAATGLDVVDFQFIVVGNEPPFTSDSVAVYRLDLDWQAIGREENRRDLRRLADCYAFQQWHAPTRGNIVTLSPPKWRLHQWEDQ